MYGHWSKESWTGIEQTVSLQFQSYTIYKIEIFDRKHHSLTTYPTP